MHTRKRSCTTIIAVQAVQLAPKDVLESEVYDWALPGPADAEGSRDEEVLLLGIDTTEECSTVAVPESVKADEMDGMLVLPVVSATLTLLADDSSVTAICGEAGLVETAELDFSIELVGAAALDSTLTVVGASELVGCMSMTRAAELVGDAGTTLVVIVDAVEDDGVVVVCAGLSCSF
nr:hypothetical protein CFP56_46648 [Quercus suber]